MRGSRVKRAKKCQLLADHPSVGDDVMDQDDVIGRGILRVADIEDEGKRFALPQFLEALESLVCLGSAADVAEDGTFVFGRVGDLVRSVESFLKPTFVVIARACENADSSWSIGLLAFDYAPSHFRVNDEAWPVDEVAVASVFKLQGALDSTR